MEKSPVLKAFLMSMMDDISTLILLLVLPKVILWN
jgi:hypothetical protein